MRCCVRVVILSFLVVLSFVFCLLVLGFFLSFFSGFFVFCCCVGWVLGGLLLLWVWLFCVCSVDLMLFFGGFLCF